MQNFTIRLLEDLFESLCTSFNGIQEMLKPNKFVNKNMNILSVRPIDIFLRLLFFFYLIFLFILDNEVEPIKPTASPSPPTPKKKEPVQEEIKSKKEPVNVVFIGHVGKWQVSFKRLREKTGSTDLLVSSLIKLVSFFLVVDLLSQFLSVSCRHMAV